MTTTSYSRSETGHIKNLRNFDDLIQVCTRFGSAYNPSASNLTLTALQNKYDTCSAAQNDVNATHAMYTHKVNGRQELFEKLPQLTTRILQSLVAHTDDKKLLKDARTYANRIHGKPPKIKTHDQQDGQEITATTRSNSQRSYDKLMDHFDNLVQLLENEPDYTPNEPELSTKGLRQFHMQLLSADKELQQALIPYNEALTIRDHEFYNPETGLINISRLVKTYIKSVFGARSLEYAEVRNLQFKTITRQHPSKV